MIKAVIFDLDDTLYPESQFVLSGFTAVDQWLKKNFSADGFLPLAKQYFAAGQRGNIFDLTLQKLKLKHDAALIKKLVLVYREHLPQISLYPDAQWALNHFKRDKSLGLITDGYLAAQKNKVTALGIAKLFKAVVYSDLYGASHWKPSSLPYLKIMEALKFKSPEYVYIGDNPAKDFITANALGWLTIQVCRQEGEYLAKAKAHCLDQAYQAQHKINSLYELDRLI